MHIPMSSQCYLTISLAASKILSAVLCDSLHLSVATASLTGVVTEVVLTALTNEPPSDVSCSAPGVRRGRLGHKDAGPRAAALSTSTLALTHALTLRGYPLTPDLALAL